MRRERLAVTPDIPDVPVMPWRIAEAGLCGDPATVARVGYVWTDPAGRSLAKAVCRSCPMSIPCLEWAVASLPATDTSVYGGTTAFQRARIRRETAAARRDPGAAGRYPRNGLGLNPWHRLAGLRHCPATSCIGGRLACSAARTGPRSTPIPAASTARTVGKCRRTCSRKAATP
jgi:WhiB family transcriptional regulator, redox-sensing transcriptional regulator